jgi:hypothetical protein
MVSTSITNRGYIDGGKRGRLGCGDFFKLVAAGIHSDIDPVSSGELVHEAHAARSRVARFDPAPILFRACPSGGTRNIKRRPLLRYVVSIGITTYRKGASL